MTEIIPTNFLKTKVGGVLIAVILYAVAQTFFSLGLEDLTNQHYPSSLVLVYVATGFLGLILVFAGLEKQSIRPRTIRPQLIRFSNIGLGTWLIAESYVDLPASSVVLMQRTEIPLTILLAFGLRTRSFDRQVRFALWIMALVVVFVAYSEWQSNHLRGISIAQLGVFSSVLGYYLMQKSLYQENQYVVLAVSALSCLFYGSVLTNYTHHWQLIAPEHLGIVAVTSLAFFLMFKSATVLYQALPLEKARFPALIAAVFTLFGEMLYEHTLFGLDYIAIILLILGLISWLLFKVNP